ncbi:MAG: phage portal protein [Amphiplicatus sp.]
MNPLARAWGALFGPRAPAKKDLVKFGEGPQPRIYRIAYFPRTDAGVWIDENTALKSDTVWAATRYLAETVGKLPWRVTRVKRDGGSEVFDRHVTDPVLHLRPNRNMHSMKFRETEIIWALHHGNGIAEIERNLAGAVIGLHPIHPDWVRFEFSTDGTLLYIVRQPSSGEVVLGVRDVLHITGFGDGVVGLGVIQYAAQTIGWQQAIQKFGANYFDKGLHPSGLLSLKETLEPAGYQLFKETFKKRYAGLENSSEPIILDVPAEFTKFSVQPDESQFIESGAAAVESICRWIGVPPSKVHHLKDAGVRANVEQEAISVVQDSIHPWVKRFELEGDAKFFPPRSGLSTSINLNALMRGDAVSRANYYAIMQRNGVLTINEVRGLEGFGRAEGGDRNLVQGQMVDIRDIGREPAGPGAPLSEPDITNPENFVLNGRGHAHGGH